MKITYAAVLAFPLLSGCVSIELPGVVSDTARVAKDAYHSVTTKKTATAPTPVAALAPAPVPAPVKAVAEAGISVSNTYIGQDSQTPAEVKQLCISEAAAKLFKATGREVGYTVAENTISAINNAIAANCRITANKVEPAAALDKPSTGA
jgi:hypothetical protein